jgi:hypothetical protein
MRMLAPRARWFGFGLGYSVAEATALCALWNVPNGRLYVAAVSSLMNVVFAVFAGCALIRVIYRLISEFAARRAAPLGTYAKSDSQRGGGAGGTDPQGL